MARARSFGNIRQLSCGRFQARYWHLGKQIPADTTFANKTDARRWLATIEVDMFRGVWIDPDAGKIPFGEYATRWVAERPVRPRTRETYEGQLRHIVRSPGLPLLVPHLTLLSLGNQQDSSARFPETLPTCDSRFPETFPSRCKSASKSPGDPCRSARSERRMRSRPTA